MKRALVIRGGAIGDFILTLPAIKLVRDSIAGCRIEILGYPDITDLALASGIADATHHIEHRRMATLFVPGASVEEPFAEWLRSFNLIVSYLHDPDGILQANMERLGVRTYLHAPHRVQDGLGHAASQLAKPLESLAMYLDDPAPRIRVPDADAPSARSIAIHPGSGSLRKNWPVEHWLRLCESLHAHRLVLITGEAERDRGTTQAFAQADIEHWDSLPLRELARRLPSCRAFLGHDSGISHLAAACGVPCHLFFGPTDPSTWAPANAGVTVHRASAFDVNKMSWHEGSDAIITFLTQNVIGGL